jgi:sugar lactone lactonase YvrE
MSNRTIATLFCGSFLALSAANLAATPPPRVFGEGSVLANIPPEAAYCAGQPDCNGGYPEGIALVGDLAYVAGPATFGTIGKGPSVVTVIQRSTGRRVAEIPIEGEDPSSEHALSGLTVDGNGNVYALSTQLGVVRIERHGQRYSQSIYATALPYLPICTNGGPRPCSPKLLDLPPISNEMTFDEHGNLYITDSTQATIFRVPPGGGTPEPWFQSPLLAGNPGAPLPFGANGIKMSPDRHWVYVIESFDPTDVTLGHLYRIRAVAHPEPGDMELVASFPPVIGPDANPLPVVPDSLAFGKSGRIYVTLANISQIAVLDPDGDEITRIGGPAGSAIPFDGPATMAFDDPTRSLLVVNHAIFGPPTDYAVLRVFVGDKGDPYPNALHPGH